MKYLLFVCGLFMASACQEKTPPEALIGHWHAQSLTVADSIWDVQVDPIQLSFSPENRYQLDWYGGQHESGKYHVNGDWLHIQSVEMPDRKLRIIYLERDSLSISGTLQDRRTVIGFNRPERPSIPE